MNKIKHELKVAGKRVILVITEKKDRIDLEWKLPDGFIRPENIQEFQEKFISFLRRYDTDKRPTHIVHPVSGQHAFIYGDAENSVGFVVPGDFNGN